MQFQSAGTICSLLSRILLQQRLINIPLGNTSVFRCKLHGVFSGIPLLLIHGHMLRNGNLFPGSTFLRFHFTAAPALDHKNTLSQRLLIFIKINEIINGCTKRCFVFFCQFPAKSHTAVAKCLPELAKRPYKPVRSFIEDYSSRFIGKLLQDDFSLFLICRKKSFESEPSGVQT